MKKNKGKLIIGNFQKSKKRKHGGEPPMDDLPTRVSRVETHIEHIRDDIRDIRAQLRWIIGLIIGSILVPILIAIFHH